MLWKRDSAVLKGVCVAEIGEGLAVGQGQGQLPIGSPSTCLMMSNMLYLNAQGFKLFVTGM